jgi:hypothetical protein
MDPVVPLPASFLQLADQLQRLSEVAEGLTYRLLEVEERLGATEASLARRLEPEHDAAQIEAIEQAERRLMDTEERLDRLETLLSQGSLTPSASSGLTLVQDDTRHAEKFLPDDSEFIEEGEQAFMDELIA